MGEKVKLTDLQSRILPVLAEKSHIGADDIAYRLGYKPARRGRLAVSRALQVLLRDGEDRGNLVYRSPPKDEWGHARWGLTPAGRAALEDENG